MNRSLSPIYLAWMAKKSQSCNVMDGDYLPHPVQSSNIVITVRFMYSTFQKSPNKRRISSEFGQEWQTHFKLRPNNFMQWLQRPRGAKVKDSVGPSTLFLVFSRLVNQPTVAQESEQGPRLTLLSIPTRNCNPPQLSVSNLPEPHLLSRPPPSLPVAHHE